MHVTFYCFNYGNDLSPCKQGYIFPNFPEFKTNYESNGERISALIYNIYNIHMLLLYLLRSSRSFFTSRDFPLVSTYD